MKPYLSILIAFILTTSCDNNDEENFTSDNTFTFDNVKYETPVCFFEDEGIEAGNRDFRSYSIQFVSHEHDGEPFVLDNPNTHALTFVLFSTSLTELASGEYTRSTATDNHLCSKEWKPGESSGIVFGLKLDNDSNSRFVEACDNVKITVKKIGHNEYYFSYGGTCESGRSLNGSFKGLVTTLDYKKWGCWED